PAALAEPADSPVRDAGRALQGQAHGARAPYRRIEFHRRIDRGGGEAFGRAAGLRPDRDASLPRPVGVVAACRRHDMAIVAYSPIARGGGKNDKVLARIGRAHEKDKVPKTAAQVSLRFLVQQGVAVIPRTSRVERLSENLAIFDFELTDAEMT